MRQEMSFYLDVPLEPICFCGVKDEELTREELILALRVSQKQALSRVAEAIRDREFFISLMR